jgi:hypothetical protein
VTGEWKIGWGWSIGIGRHIAELEANMGSLMITRLTVSDGSRSVTYDSKQNQSRVFLEATEEPDIYKVVLREGQYGHLGDAAGIGFFDVELAAGPSIRGQVIGSVPAQTADGVNTPDILELTLKVQRD